MTLLLYFDDVLMTSSKHNNTGIKKYL